MPTAVITTDAFAAMGQSTARSLGLAGIPLSAAPHPFDYLSRAQVREIAERLLGEVETILTGKPEQLEQEYARRVWLSPNEAVASCSVSAHKPQSGVSLEMPRHA